MNPMNKAIAPTILLLLTAAIAFGLPKPKYKGTDIIPSLTLPTTIPGWKTQDVSDKIDLRGEDMNFLSHVLAREYSDVHGRSLLLLILDADNFHHPKTCIGGSGFEARDLEDMEFKLPNRTWKAKTIYFQKGDEGFLTVYWICINKKQMDWTGQKLIQLWYSLFNKEKTGIMVRIDIAVTKDQIKEAHQSIQELLTTLASQIPSQQNEYIFGK